MRELQEQGTIIFPAKIQNPKSTIEMREPTADSAIAYAVALLKHYGFELRGYTAEELVNLWLRHYKANWVRLAVIEALYQGRYKAVSVEQILAVWARRGQPIYRFNHEFERLICRKLPQNLAVPLKKRLTDLSLETPLPLILPPFLDTLDEEVEQDFTPQEPTSTIKPDTPPTAILPTDELSEIPIQSTDELNEVQPDINTRPSYKANWSRCEVKKQPIHQFTPPPDDSGFYFKLKAVVQQQEELPAKNGTPSTDECE
jgi:hypothetical protein